MTSLTAPAAVRPPAPLAVAAAPPRLLGAAFLGYVTFMAIGAIAWATTGVDFDTALEAGASLQLYADIAESRGTLMLAFTSWMLATPFFLAAGALVARRHADRPAALLAGSMMQMGAAVAVVAFMGFLTMTVAMAPLHATLSGELATTMNYLVSRADWIATILIIGLPPALLSFAMREEWPRWLVIGGYLGLLTSALTILAMATGTGLATFGFAIVPVGMAWSLAVGIRLVRGA